jgi:hypothetical protein
VSKLGGKVAVITGATSGMALATAKLFVAEGAYVYITGRRADKLDEAVTAIGHPVTGVAGDAGNLHDLDRLVDTVHARPRPDTDLVATASGPYKEGNRLGEAGNEGRRSAPRGSSTRNSTTRQPASEMVGRGSLACLRPHPDWCCIPDIRLPMAAQRAATPAYSSGSVRTLDVSSARTLDIITVRTTTTCERHIAATSSARVADRRLADDHDIAHGSSCTKSLTKQPVMGRGTVSICGRGAGDENP